jgi:hypothetical protein
LPQDDPAAAWFRHCLLTYASGEHFQPRTQITPERLAQLFQFVPAPVPRVGGTGQPGEDLNALPPKKN